jgi:hypothetical protein
MKRISYLLNIVKKMNGMAPGLYRPFDFLKFVWQVPSNGIGGDQHIQSTHRANLTDIPYDGCMGIEQLRMLIVENQIGDLPQCFLAVKLNQLLIFNSIGFLLNSNKK